MREGRSQIITLFVEIWKIRGSLALDSCIHNHLLLSAQCFSQAHCCLHPVACFHFYFCCRMQTMWQEGTERAELLHSFQEALCPCSHFAKHLYIFKIYLICLIWWALTRDKNASFFTSFCYSLLFHFKNNEESHVVPKVCQQSGWVRCFYDSVTLRYCKNNTTCSWM